ncbi:MAG: glycoside hydrolase family 13 protein [Candidatus Marinimicrobia bacterium]|nr:glycoside hydrolase family 13 protein [Candidatus Neomarinimicrobiota bacterium]
MRIITISLLILNIVTQAQNPPDWAADAIWYQILPDRFYNGDLENDPTKESLYGVWPWEYQTDWQVSPWTSDWYFFQPWEEANGQHFRYQFQIRRYGGDIQGIIDKLDYLQELGINAIYLNPIFQSPSSHKYGTESYRHIDRFFGPDPEGDRLIVTAENPLDPSTWQWTAADKLFLELIRQVHLRNMRIIIDGVFNHVGLTFWAFQDVIANRSASPYYYWFNVKGSGGEDLSHLNDYQTLPDFFLTDGQTPLEYTGYVADLPAFRQDINGPLEPVRKHIRNIVQRWGDPNGDGDPSDGIDGWRLDVAERLQMNFWKQFNKWVKDLNPEAYLTGEIWWEDYWNNQQFNAAPWLTGDVFDAVMNYRFGDTMFKFFLDEKQQISATELDDLLKSARQDYRPETAYALQNMLDSHDMERLASAAANPDRWMDHGNNLQYNPDFKISPPDQVGWSKIKAILTFQFTYPGAPYIYYGDEVGMWGADDPDCRKPMVWAEYNFDDETAHPCDRLPDCNYSRDCDKVCINLDILNTYKTLIQLRKKYSALMHGSYQTVLTANEKGLIAFQRSNKNEIILAVFNSSKSIQEIPENLLNRNKLQLVFSSESKSQTNHQLSPNSAKIFRTSL